MQRILNRDVVYITGDFADSLRLDDTHESTYFPGIENPRANTMYCVVAEK